MVLSRFGLRLCLILISAVALCAGFVTAIARRLDEPIFRLVEAFGRGLAIAFPATDLGAPLSQFPAETAYAGTLKTRVVSFEDRRRKRDPVAMAAGCGLRLAA